MVSERVIPPLEYVQVPRRRSAVTHIGHRGKVDKRGGRAGWSDHARVRVYVSEHMKRGRGLVDKASQVRTPRRVAVGLTIPGPKRRHMGDQHVDGSHRGRLARGGRPVAVPQRLHLGIGDAKPGPVRQEGQCVGGY